MGGCTLDRRLGRRLLLSCAWGPDSAVLRVGSFDVSGWHIEDIEIGIATEVDLLLDRPEASPEGWLRVMMERASALPWEEVALPVNGEGEPFRMPRNGR